MNGFMQWFKAGSKMKRWMFLILVGIILACYGLAKILVMKEISIGEVGEVILIFAIGFVAIVIGLVFLNKRTLEVLIESSDERMENKDNVNLKSLIFNKTVYDKGPNIVVIGGGTGLDTVLMGLKNYTNNVTAIVTISDYGEGITDSRRELKTMPLDDVKDSLVALSANEKQVGNLLNYKFKTGRLSGLNFSDIYFSAMKEINGNFEDSIIKSNEVLNMIGKVIPVTLDEMKIVAELANGYIVEEKSRIPEVVSDKVTKINRIMISPTNCRPAPGVVEAIKNADCIVIGPGSLYTNVIPNLLVNGVTKAIKESTAIKVYISNIMTEPGQTDDYSIADHINAITEHCGTGIIDYCIYDTGEIIPEYIKKYNREGQDIVEQDISKIKGIKFLQRNLSIIKGSLIRHDPSLVAASIIELICDDLKYQDKQGDPQYLMLNNKLREEKRINKIKKKTAKNAQREREGKANKKKKTLKSKSKFSSKYSDRIESIREADKKAEAKMKQRKNQEGKTKRKPARRTTKAKQKTNQEIREEMLKKLENSKLK
ncbi:MAG: uridine diphosphate-N-acetylglucosamine-binding protein YvcK [Clostridiales bacterium]|nr:uridine diphosphate-N-acetylglucosamine-binding protein YvcK [Clostridiales bacterium]